MKSLKFVFKYTPKYVGPLALTVVSMLLLVGVQLLTPWIVKTMVATVTDPTAGPEAVGYTKRTLKFPFSLALQWSKHLPNYHI